MSRIILPPALDFVFILIKIPLHQNLMTGAHSVTVAPLVYIYYSTLANKLVGGGGACENYLSVCLFTFSLGHNFLSFCQIYIIFHTIVVQTQSRIITLTICHINPSCIPTPARVNPKLFLSEYRHDNSNPLNQYSIHVVLVVFNLILICNFERILRSVPLLTY